MLEDAAPLIEPADAGVAESVKPAGARGDWAPSTEHKPSPSHTDPLIVPRRPAGRAARPARSSGQGRSEDLRRGPRTAVNARIWLSDGRVQRFTRMVNVSVGGARVVTACPPPVGAVMSLSFQLSPDLPPISGQGVVVWRVEGHRGRGGVVGLEFLHVDNPELISQFAFEY